METDEDAENKELSVMYKLWLDLKLSHFYLDLVNFHWWKKMYKILNELIVDNLPVGGLDL